MYGLYVHVNFFEKKKIMTEVKNETDIYIIVY